MTQELNSPPTNRMMPASLAREETFRSPVRWREQLSAAICNVDMEPLGQLDFRSSLSSVQLDVARCLRTRQTPQHHVRSRAAIARDACSDVFLSMTLDGSQEFQQFGRQVRADVGDCIVIDAASSFEYRCPQGTHALHMQVPRAYIAHYLGNIEDVAALRINGLFGWGAAFSTFFRTLGTGEAPVVSTPALLLSQLVQLLVFALEPQPSQVTSSQAATARRILSTIRDRCTEEGLTPDVIAEDIGISRRSLDRILAATRTTFCAELERARLNVAYGLLAGPGGARLTVGEIVGHCGFTSAAHFARKFRLTHGISPTSFRKSLGLSELHHANA